MGYYARGDIIMKYEHNQICTADKEIVVGHQYDYSEDSSRFRVVVLKDKSDEESLGFKLKILSEPRDVIFDVFAARGEYAYSGMWRLYDPGEYLRGEYDVDKENIPDGELIGYSMSHCVASICRNKISLNRVKKIIAGTKAKNEEVWGRVIADYKGKYWPSFPEEAEKVAWELIRSDKVKQPRLGDKEEGKFNTVWEAA